MHKHLFKMSVLSFLLLPLSIQAVENLTPCTTETFADRTIIQKLARQFLWSTLEEKGRDHPTQEDYIDVCLGGKHYKIIDRLGSGDEGDVYEMMNDQGKKFALKLYRANIEGDLLVMKKANYSKEYLNVPLLVSIQYGYAIFPLLKYIFWVDKRTMPYEKRMELESFISRMQIALAQDGLHLEDIDNPQNYMYDTNRRLWRIDLGTIFEVKRAVAQ